MPLSRDARKNRDVQHRYRKPSSRRFPATSSEQCVRHAALDLLLAVVPTRSQLSRLAEPRLCMVAHKASTPSVPKARP